MTNRVRSLAVVAALLLVTTISSPTSVQGQETAGAHGAIEAMETFLTSWLVRDERSSTVNHFGTSDQSLSLAPTYLLGFGGYDPDVAAREVRTIAGDGTNRALPPGVAFGYWEFLNRLWPSAGRVDTNLEGLLVTDLEELIAFLKENFEFELEYIQKSPFIAFYSDDRIVLDAFDAGFAAGGYGQLADVLQPSEERPILTMIADFRHAQSDHIGPLVTFWREEESGNGERAWRIQALGAFPED